MDIKGYCREARRNHPIQIPGHSGSVRHRFHGFSAQRFDAAFHGILMRRSSAGKDITVSANKVLQLCGGFRVNLRVGRTDFGERIDRMLGETGLRVGAEKGKRVCLAELLPQVLQTNCGCGLSSRP